MSMAHNLQQHAKRFLPYSNRTRRFFCSDINKTLWASNLTLQDRIESALEQKAGITTVLEQWRQQHGHRLNPSLVRGVFVKLCTSLQPHHALEVSDWMIKHKICNLTPEDYTDRFHLIENVLGFQEAENFFESIPENLRGESIYNSLLRNYAKRSGINDLDRAEFNFKKMRELGLLVRLSPNSSMVSLYTSFGIRHRVDEILKDMKEINIELDSVTVNNSLRVYASESDVEGMDKFLDDWKETVTLELLTMLDMAKAYLRAGDKGKAKVMLRKTEELMEDPKSYVELMRLYGEAGVRDGVYIVYGTCTRRRQKTRTVKDFKLCLDLS
ncbi:putative pentatricopeptide repeat-containing protein [Cardamine amara subsp. amara]|uniref:Pentatricopeptide repeat-containing protein n=1 Tax=Cardamine amara subsp. amara TaxID=228776 RepID=A0ABD1BYE1_CARAN